MKAQEAIFTEKGRLVTSLWLRRGLAIGFGLLPEGGGRLIPEVRHRMMAG